jgi:CRISPR system Cascade subunit CasD
MQILTFALVAPLASFGSLAVGERRAGWDRPARSAVLGLVGACLGVDRDDDDAQGALAHDYGLALLCHAPGRLLTDFHTAQVPSARRGVRYATRAEELAVEKLNTVLSRRDYRVGAWHLGALWPRGDARWSLDAIADAMHSPTYFPCLGRRSCPLGLPLAPKIVEAADPSEALLARHRDGPEAQLQLRGRRWRDVIADQPGELLVTVDAADAAGDPRLRRVERRRDQPLSRKRWQFDLRDEGILGVAP